MNKQGPWTQFWDMSSGGGQKTEYSKIYIQASQNLAEQIFEELFGRDPHYVTCDCCGPDFSITEYETLEEATGYHRNCQYIRGQGYVERQDPNKAKYGQEDWNRYWSLEEYIIREDVGVFFMEGTQAIPAAQLLGDGQ